MTRPVPSRLLPLSLVLAGSFANAADANLPFPETSSASKAGKTLADSRHQWRKPAERRAADTPNILVIMLDDAGFAQSDAVGGAIHTPTLQRIMDTGIRYNAFHTTAISSATRAALLTGRNHHRVGNGVVSEIATDFDGYTGRIPDSAATVAEVLKHYGYSTAAFGKWHNTPVLETTSQGPFDQWPTGRGFDYFYGFMGGETDQYHPRLYQGTTPIEPPHDGKYHLSEDLATQAVGWLRKHRTLTPDKPFFMYWTPGAVHAPLQVFQEWTDKYKGKFDDGWDVYRQRAFERQKAMGWIPQDTELTPRPVDLPAWDSLSAEEKKFQSRLMEIYAGFMEHVDAQAGRIVDELERQGVRDNTLIFYVLGDNGASSEGVRGSVNQMLALNGIPVPVAQQMQVVEKMYGGLDALGGPKLEAHYHAAWAWAGESPFVGTKLVAGYFGGTRTPLAVSWPKKVKADSAIRTQFHHVTDIAPTIYEATGITPPKAVNGVKQQPFDGVSMAYTFADARTATRKREQYFEVFGSRGIYKDGWMASVFGPRRPWNPSFSQFIGWKPENDQWALFRLDGDYSQARDLAAENPAKLAELQKAFDRAAQDNHVYPLGAGLLPFLDPAAKISTGLREWHFGPETSRLPEFTAPNLRSANSMATVDAEFPENASGVLYALGGIGGGVTLYADKGELVYEFNDLAVARIKLKAPQKIAAGRHRIEVETTVTAAKPGSPLALVLRVDGVEVAKGTTPFSPPLTFSATETFDVGIDLGSPVALDYFDRAPFRFDGRVNDVHVVCP
ncbi:arylsulfatase [Azoarcus sp. KH32C]|uniref:arylsulfatase n=1 Tax=Azoarcus sp. KH32C TaxID=748247 RepID=UPI0002386932|nr:arylsulfatase [Azoarcus sp. KH32C]BAL24261.1 sulfatase [Azoarcus sp. KH32C]